MKYKKFDYYIFIDFSENIIGYNIISYDNMIAIIPKISKFSHYKKLRHKKQFIKSIKKIINKENIISYFVKNKIKEMRNNIDIYSDILEFLKKHENCIIFISVDNSQYFAFKRMVQISSKDNITMKKESELKFGTPEYQTSLVLDTLLNIERLKLVK